MIRRDRLIWLLVFLAMFASAWAYASTLKASSSAQSTLLPLDVGPLQARSSPLRPLPAAAAPADPFAPGSGTPPPAAPPPPVPLPPPPVPQPPLEPSPPPAVASAVSAPFKLTGIVVGAVRRAILEVKDTAYIVKEGDVVEGWAVIRIEPRRVILRGPSGEEIVLELEESRGQGN